MARKGKWVEGVLPEEPVSAAAHRALDARLSAVADYLPRAAHDAHHDIEHVHQLRVATRRAMAALELFRDLLPDDRCGTFERKLRKVRRAAGEARDADVFLTRLVARGREDDSWRSLLARVKAWRKSAQPAIVAIDRKLGGERWSRRQRKLLKRIAWRPGADDAPEPTFAVAARTRLEAIQTAFRVAGQANLASVEALHQFRIRGKELRYAMEIFAAAFAPEFRAQVYPLVEDLQTRLGLVNDHATALERVGTWEQEWSDEVLGPALHQLRAEEEAALEAARSQFFEWWTPRRAQDLDAVLRAALVRATDDVA
jgi:CHAD domain-containing protein